jgi:ribosome biogenesis protein ENP2
MHGYFLSLKLYDAARVIANPFAYAEHREKMVREKMEKMAETRIRTKKDAGVKVNKALADKILRDEERARKRAEKRRSKMAEIAGAGDGMEVEVEHDQGRDKPNLLTDPRFARLFEDPDFAVDENTREYALMNPSAVAQQGRGKLKTAVEEEEEESDKPSSDGLGESESEEDDDKDDDGSDSSEAGGESFRTCHGSLLTILFSELNKFDPRARPGQKNQLAQDAYARNRQQNRVANVNFVPLRAQTEADGKQRSSNLNATFGQQRKVLKGSERVASRTGDGGMEMSWVPSKERFADGEHDVPGRSKERRKGVESFGMGMERGGESQSVEINENDRKGRTQRRKGIRSGSKNALRRIGR